MCSRKVRMSALCKVEMSPFLGAGRRPHGITRLGKGSRSNRHIGGSGRSTLNVPGRPFDRPMYDMARASVLPLALISGARDCPDCGRRVPLRVGDQAGRLLDR
jgi:hypothetical protein